MATITNILIPVDLRVETTKVLEYARLLAEQFGAKQHLLTVIPGPGAIAGTEFDTSWYEKHAQELREEAGKVMEAFVAKNFGGNKPASAAVVLGDIVDEIVNYADTKGCDCIVIGTHGRHGVARIFFGSVAEGVVRRARCPVLTLHPFE